MQLHVFELDNHRKDSNETDMYGSGTIHGTGGSVHRSYIVHIIPYKRLRYMIEHLMPESKQQAILRNVRSFYEDEKNLRALTDVLGKQSHLSLRLFDWLVTNYAKKYNVVYTLESGQVVNVYSEYRNWLRGYSKRNFDPFKRRERMMFTDSDGKEFVTTIGQLNFFRFVIESDVLPYLTKNLKRIESDMLANVGNTDKKRERKELNKAAISRCTKTRLNVVVNFNT